MKLSRNTGYVTEAALIAALYVVFTLLSALFGLDKGVIQLRLSEALAVLPAFTAAAIPGLAVGCALASLLCGGLLLDVLFGSLITLFAAILCRLICGIAKRRFGGILLPLPNTLLNAFFIPLILIAVYGVPDAYPYLLLTVGAGEFLASQVLGTLLFYLLRKNRMKFSA